MAVKWIKTNFPGVRYYEHDTRKHGMQKDRYFTIRYRMPGKRFEEGLGWASEGMSASKANLILSGLKKAQVSGEGHFTLREKREYEQERKERKRIEKEKSRKESVTFGEYFEKTYFPDSRVGKKEETTRKEREHFKNWIKPVIGETPLKDLRPLAIEKIKKNVLDAGKTPRTLQYVFATIRQVWNRARRDGLVEGESPTRQVRIPKFDNRRVRFLSHEEAETLLNALQEKDRLTHNLALLSLHTGLRMGEMGRLKWSHIDLDRGIITVMDPKGGEGRVAFMTDKVKAMFRAMKRQDPDDYVFTRKAGEHLEDMPKIFFAVVKDLEFNRGISDPRQKIVAHSLRHTFASWHAAAGTDIYTLKTLMGHSVIQMTERYAHLSNGTLQGATKNLEKSFNQKKDSNIVEIIRGE
ncbi:MAG TPA: tyrosine-type recombinase/integrase [Syntrophales bacterium]|nr:tyrosine-type recombinase/integrase [Syntrophales bacterium]